jgi:outer membrane protein assembly factor BamB
VSEDFTTRLRLQLREAALREERRGTLRRAVAVGRPTRPAAAASSAWAAAAAACLVIAVGLWMVGSLRREPAAPSRPRIVADVQLANALGSSGAAAFGAVWLSDTARGDVLRVDPRTRRVVARIHVGAEVQLAAGGGSVWAVVDATTGIGPLLRIDPRTNRIAARIGVRLTAYPGGSGVLVGRQVWVIGQTEAIRVDPARGRIAGTVRARRAFQFTNAALLGGQVWLGTGDGRLIRYDDRTGRRLGGAPWRVRGALFPSLGRFVVLGDRTVTLVEPVTGRALWRSALARAPLRDLQVAALAGGRAYLVGRDGPAPRDRLLAVDARDGRVAPPLSVPEFGTIGMVGDGGRRVWLLTSGGRVVVVDA